MGKNQILLRPATMADALMLYTWRNDPQTRYESHNQDEIDFKAHLEWLENSLRTNNRRIYIAEVDKVPVGTIRSDYNKGFYELSWTVGPEYRGRGFGKQMVMHLSKQIRGSIRAEIKIENLASRYIAEACEMTLDAQKDGIMYYSKIEQLLEYCVLCGKKAHPAFIKGEFSYKRCTSCETLFVANQLQADDIYINYSQAYFEATSPAAEANKERRGYPSYMEAQESLKRSFTHKLDFICSLTNGGKLLDVGAAYGTFMVLANINFECVGLDVSEFAANTARKNFGVDVRQGNIEQNTSFQDNTFDVIVMWDIIEHLVDPIKGLKEVYRILKPSGYLFVSTDDADNWLPHLLGNHWWALAAPLHLCHFSKKGMAIAFQQAGEFDKIGIVSDKREYCLYEIASHFGVSYKNKFLMNTGKWLEQTSFGSKAITVIRPEQFIAFARKRL